MFSKILVICVGNICRSPMAACLLKERLANKGFNIISAGVGALVDQPMDPFAEATLQAHHVNYSQHRAQQLQRSHVQDADIVLIAEKKLIEQVLKIAPEARGKIFTLGKWQNDRNIPDPYRQSRAVFEHTYVLINEAIEAWVKHLI